MTGKDETVSLHIEPDQLERIEKARKIREEREKKEIEEEEERRANLEALERFEKEQKDSDKQGERKKDKGEEEEELEVTPAVKNISFAMLLIATVLGGIVSIGMIAAEIYLVMHFSLCWACNVLIVIQCLLIVVGTISRWLSWFIKTRKVKTEKD
jgi:Flp pilus assembly protein TadB